MKNEKIVSLAFVAMGVFLSSCGGSSTKVENEVAKTDSVVAMSLHQQLPSDAKKVTEGHGVVAYIQPVAKGVMCDINAVWVTDDKGGNVARICLSDENSKKVYAWEKDGQTCLTKDIFTADTVYIVKDAKTDKVYLVVSGCPDMRNIYSYLIPVDFNALNPDVCFSGENLCTHIPAAEDFVGYDAATNTLVFSSYGYHEEGGRYSVKKNFDFNGKLVSEGKPEDE